MCLCVCVWCDFMCVRVCVCVWCVVCVFVCVHFTLIVYELAHFHSKGFIYNIPVGIYLHKDYPYQCPYCQVQPTPDMMISPSKYVNQHGVIFLPYLQDWNHVSRRGRSYCSRQLNGLVFEDRIYILLCRIQLAHNSVAAISSILSSSTLLSEAL